jgi:hypothetical protein
MTTKEELKEAQGHTEICEAWVSAAKAHQNASDVDLARAHLAKARSKEKEPRRRVRLELWELLDRVVWAVFWIAGAVNLVFTIARCVDG